MRGSPRNNSGQLSNKVSRPSPAAPVHAGDPKDRFGSSQSSCGVPSRVSRKRSPLGSSARPQQNASERYLVNDDLTAPPLLRWKPQKKCAGKPHCWRSPGAGDEPRPSQLVRFKPKSEVTIGLTRGRFADSRENQGRNYRAWGERPPRFPAQSSAGLRCSQVLRIRRQPVPARKLHPRTAR